MRCIRLPIFHKVCDSNTFCKALIDTTNHRDGLQRFPLPVGIGRAKFVNDISFKEIEQTLKKLRYVYKIYS